MLKKISLLFMLCCIFAACIPAACATGDGSASSEAAVISEITEEETADEGAMEEVVTEEETAEEVTEDVEEEVEPAEGEISDAQYKAYVLGFLLYFTIVSLFYFCYKFFRMFF